jgi:hypothetical protein
MASDELASPTVTTIREQLQQRAARIRLVARIGIPVLCIGIMLLVFPHFSQPIRKAVKYLLALLTVFLFYLLQRRLTCPRCRASLSSLWDATTYAGISRCPHCGANFDETVCNGDGES